MPSTQQRMPSTTRIIGKVAAVTLAFWIMKILATTLGETAGDVLSMGLDLGPYLSFILTFAALAVILFVQIKVPRYHPALFWLAIVATTTAGTEIFAMIGRSFGPGYTWGPAIPLAGLMASLVVWYARARTLAVYPILRRDVEILFWIAVVFSNSLGTAFGDVLTATLSLTSVEAGLVTAAIIGALVACHSMTRLSHVLLFWIAFIVTRPFGETFGDLLTRPLEKGGMDLPLGQASMVTLGLLVLVLVLSTLSATRARSMLDPSPKARARHGRVWG